MSSSSAPAGSATAAELGGPLPQGLDRQPAVTDRDFDVLDRIDARHLGSHKVFAVGGVVFHAQQMVVEERTQTGERGQPGPKCESSDSSGSEARD